MNSLGGCLHSPPGMMVLTAEVVDVIDVALLVSRDVVLAVVVLADVIVTDATDVVSSSSIMMTSSLLVGIISILTAPLTGLFDREVEVLLRLVVAIVGLLLDTSITETETEKSGTSPKVHCPSRQCVPPGHGNIFQKL